MLTLAPQSIDADHLARYQQVCGLRVSHALPPTYLHVLAFPVAVALMTQRSFPLPLVGLVHVHNTITVARPVDSGEQASFRVRAVDLRPHRGGRQFDVVAEASVGAELVWTARSTYLRVAAATRPRCRTGPPDVDRRRLTGDWRGCGSPTTPDGATPRCRAT